ncbi:MAG TPA: amylo-alpha-1,6-glucosidase [Xanthobacteraceae bacterium]|nr:amylo-alpha-1,6-glucosidase [Xanthobacteraceae bacterium]
MLPKAHVGETKHTEAAETPFYIPATQGTTGPSRTLKHGDCFAITDSFGDVGTADGGADGIFYSDTRFLSRLEMKINGQQPLMLGSNVRDDNSILTVDLTNPDFYVGSRLVLAKDLLHVVRTIFLWRGVAYQRVRVHNHGEEPFSVRFTFEFDNDFADLFEVRGMQRMRRGRMTAEMFNDSSVILHYVGLDEKVRRTAIHFDPPPQELSTGHAVYDFDLEPNENASLFITVKCRGDDFTLPMPFRKSLRAAFHEHRTACRGMATVETSNDIFNEVLCRSISDLVMLRTSTAQGPYPYAGIPWYSTTFGRDGLITAMQTLWIDPRVARGVLRRLAYFQATDFDPLNDAEPGKILHEMRGGEMAGLREIPFGQYYGSVDSTPLFVMLTGMYFDRTGDIEALGELWPHVEAALGWINGPGDPDKDGFVEYHRADENGLLNQGWKDSQDAIFHADGSLAAGPIALCEVQGYVYAAKRAAARVASRLGKVEFAAALEAQAALLAQRFEDAFWCEELGTYALALDGEKRPCRVRTSNAGQVLFSGIASKEHAARVAQDLLRPSFFSGWGIRTVAREELRYNPMSYHNGSVWPHDNALIAAGFMHYGFQEAVERVFKGLFDAASYMDLRRLPELYCGFQRGRQRGPTLYPVACSPQAWAAGTPLSLLQSSIGLEISLERGEVVLRNPRLPQFLDEVILRHITVGSCFVDLALRRHGTDVSVRVLRNDGKLRVAVIYG